MGGQRNGDGFLTREEKRLKEDREKVKYWKKWGPYVPERQWGTGEHRLPWALWGRTGTRADFLIFFVGSSRGL